MNKIYVLRSILTGKYLMTSSGDVIWYPVRELIEQQKEHWEDSIFYSSDNAVEIVEFEVSETARSKPEAPKNVTFPY